MKLVPNAGAILRKSHSMWSMYSGVACLLAPEMIYAFLAIDTNPRIWWIAALAFFVYGILGRIVDQGIDNPKPPTMRSPFTVGLIAMSMLVVQPGQGPAPDTKAPVSGPYSYSDAEFNAIAIPHIGKWEGLRLEAYLDTIASPAVWTVCYGETKGVKKGDRYSKEQCDAMLAREVAAYRADLHDYFDDDTKSERLTAARDVSYVDLAYNAGVRGAGTSTATRRLNAGDIRGGCEALGWWNKAGGRVIRGLVNRRQDSIKLCVQGL